MTSGDSAGSPLSPLFFLSYARVKLNLPMRPQDLDAPVVRFYHDLSVHVNQLVSPPVGVGFIDRALLGGERWEDDLIQAVSTCQVFVPLISPAYLASAWCLREWDIFAARTVVTTAAVRPHSAILPVIWIPTDFDRLPAQIKKIQFFAPVGLPDPLMAVHYRENGIYGLLARHQDDTYDNIVWKLAQRVAEICKSHRVEPVRNGPTEANG